MFHALIAQLAEGERDNVERAVAASGLRRTVAVSPPG